MARGLVYDFSKSSGDPWVLVAMEHVKRLWISDWKTGDLESGWLGSGTTKHGVRVSI
jgi:hypothetical protein